MRHSNGTRRVPHLPSAIVGNGSVLATLSARGELERIFWPNIDWGQHLGELRLGIAVDGCTLWLDEPPFQHEQRYLEDANVVETRAHAPGTAATVTDFVDPDAPVLFRAVRVDGPGARLIVYARPEIDESARYGGVYVDRTTGALVFYRRGRALAVGLMPAPEVRTGQVGERGDSVVFADAADGRLAADAVAYGTVDGALSTEVDRDACCVIAFGAGPDDATAALIDALETGPEAALARRCAQDKLVLDQAEPAVAETAEGRRLYRRSLLTFDLVTDRASGGVIAAPELDGEFQRCGGYGFVWGRDMAFSALAFLAAGRDDLASRALGWLTRTQAPEGLWLHRHCADGSLAPSWGMHQVDETGAVLFAFEAAWRELRDDELDAAVWPAARRAADFLVGFRDHGTGLPGPSVDLWEERLGAHAYSAAAVQAGLRAGADIARRHDASRASGYADAAAEIANAIERELWDEPSQHYRRALGRPPSTNGAARLRYPDEVAASVLEVVGAQAEVDCTLDASLIGLGWPFSAVDPAGPRMRQTMEALRRRLETIDGGIRRYDGDTYAGGNAWILTTLWLALWCRQIGDEDGYRGYSAYALSRRTPLGLLPEQAALDGSPAWVVPLTWSHAMFVLASRPELRIVEDYTRAA
jgi:oligosaccharide amylase